LDDNFDSLNGRFSTAPEGRYVSRKKMKKQEFELRQERYIFKENRENNIDVPGIIGTRKSVRV
jgi:hypothetical protein